MNDVQVVNENGMAVVEDYKQVAIDYLKNMGMNLPQKWANQFIELSKLYGLNPFKREIYAVGYGDNYNIITGYEVYLKRAERIGKLNGWDCKVSGSGNDMEATITIYRKDWEHPFIHTVYYPECVQLTREGKPNKTWAKMPRFMLKKVAVAQGFRMCFSDEMGGMPYTSDEMPEGERVEKVVNPEVQLSHEAQKVREEELKPANVSENVLNLESLLNEYKDAFNVQPKAYQMALDVLNRGDDKECFEKFVSCKNYLLSKGIQVA